MTHKKEIGIMISAVLTMVGYCLLLPIIKSKKKELIYNGENEYINTATQRLIFSFFIIKIVLSVRRHQHHSTTISK